MKVEDKTPKKGSKDSFDVTIRIEDNEKDMFIEGLQDTIELIDKNPGCMVLDITIPEVLKRIKEIIERH